MSNITKKAFAEYSFMGANNITSWSPTDIDKLDLSTDNYSSILKACRFFYKKDPIVSTVINKMVDIAITDIEFDKGQLSENEYRVFTGLSDEIYSFMTRCALEYLISGFVIPEIDYAPVGKEKLLKMGVKKYTALYIPENMWLRNPDNVKIKSTMIIDKPSYFITVPDELISFIQSGGVYSDGSKDVYLYSYIQSNYPTLFEAAKANIKDIPYYNDLIIRRRVLSDSYYPIPFLLPALEILNHKRNLRRMDYSIAARVISAIQHIKVGSDEFPVLEDEEDIFNDLRNQMAWRNTSGRNMERILQLFTNHTVEIDWVFPPVDALLSETKYVDVNKDIFFALGFPRILTTGETEPTQTTNAEIALISPVKTMEQVQKDLLPILKSIAYEISIRNDFKHIPEVKFKKISLYSIEQFLNVMKYLFESGAISKEILAKEFGYIYNEEEKK